MSSVKYGAYGFALEGIRQGELHLVEAPDDWPAMQVARRAQRPSDPKPGGTVRIFEEAGEVWLPDGDLVEITRNPLSVCVLAAEPVSEEAILHPLLGLPAAIASSWLGRHSLHGGAFVRKRGAWALLGDREAGKSATLACLLARGYPIVSDDILVLEGTTVFAGPRSVDLRAEVAAVAGGEPLGVLGTRERFRLRPPPCPAALPLAGVVKLDWGESTQVEEMAAGERLRTFVDSSVFVPKPDASLALLELAALPGLRVTRARDLAALESLTDQMLDALDELA